MAKIDFIYFKVLIICWNLTLISCLQLEYQVTNKPRHTKYSSTRVPPSGSLSNVGGSTPSNGVATYRLKDSKGGTCILLKTDALIEIKFTSNIGNETGNSYIPDNPTIEGSCKSEDENILRISWTGYNLLWHFYKTPGGERWYASNMVLTVSTDLEQYHNIKTSEGHTFKLYHDSMLIPTPVGKSYSCEETGVQFYAKKDEDDPDSWKQAPKDLSGTLILRAFQIQPFIFKGNTFGPAHECSLIKSFRDETAPVVVGSLLAIAVLCTITGYGVFRYLKIKKVQYNTMD